MPISKEGIRLSMDSIKRLWAPRLQIPALRWNSGLKFSSPFLIFAPSRSTVSVRVSTRISVGSNLTTRAVQSVF
jgi:hypothetical protein